MTPTEGHGAMFAARAFDQHGPAVHRYFRRLTGDRTTADDLTQEVFLRIVRGAAGYEPMERERAWVFRIARNVLLDDRRRVRSRQFVPMSVDQAAPATQAMTAGLGEGLGRLAPEEREALLLGEVGGLTYGEIAAATGTSVPTVRHRIYRARLALRKTLCPPAPEPGGAIAGCDDHE
jgi:RNA polymerase sigma-70 factor (ECF subfamily)